MDDNILTAKQAGELLKVSRARVAKLARRGEIPGRKVGHDWRFRRDTLLAWLAGEADKAANE